MILTELMRFFLIILFLSSNVYAKQCSIGLSDEVARLIPRILNYIDEIIVPAYKRSGLDCKLQILPNKRLITFEQKDMLDVLILRIKSGNIEDLYTAFPIPLTKPKKAYYIGKNNPKSIGVVRGSAYQDYLVQKHAPLTTKYYANQATSIYRMYLANRVDGFYIIGPYFHEYIEKDSEHQVPKKQVDELYYYHFVSKRLKPYHKAVFNELMTIYKNGQLNFEYYGN